MPLGILSDEEFEKELIKGNNVDENKSVVKELPTSGRNEGDINKPETIRQIIAECKINGDSDNDIKESFKTSTSSINAYSNGKNGTNDKTNTKLARFVKNARNVITRKASRTLIKTLDHITEDRISELRANEMSVLAKNMSSIIADMEEKNRNVNNGIQANFVVYAPPQKSIEKYEVVEVDN